MSLESESKTFDEVLREMCEGLIEDMRQAFDHQREQNIFTGIHRSGSVTTAGGNHFKVSLGFEACAGAKAMPSRN